MWRNTIYPKSNKSSRLIGLIYEAFLTICMNILHMTMVVLFYEYKNMSICPPGANLL